MLKLSHAAVANPLWIELDLALFTNSKALNCLSYVNADMKFVSQLHRFRGFHIIRDPRDLAVSAYFSHKHSHSVNHWPELIEHRNILLQNNIKSGLLMDFEFTNTLTTDGYNIGVFRNMTEWNYHQENVIELRYEKFFIEIIGTLTELFCRLGLIGNGHETKILQDVLLKYSFKKLSDGRKSGQVDPHHHYRGGRSGEWRQYFDKIHRDWFKDRYGDFLIHRGYESNYDWQKGRSQRRRTINVTFRRVLYRIKARLRHESSGTRQNKPSIRRENSRTARLSILVDTCDKQGRFAETEIFRASWQSGEKRTVQASCRLSANRS